jgi:hypothetical protein
MDEITAGFDWHVSTPFISNGTWFPPEIPQGWQCPKCGWIFSPSEKGCCYCNPNVHHMIIRKVEKTEQQVAGSETDEDCDMLTRIRLPRSVFMVGEGTAWESTVTIVDNRCTVRKGSVLFSLKTEKLPDLLALMEACGTGVGSETDDHS